MHKRSFIKTAGLAAIGSSLGMDALASMFEAKKSHSAEVLAADDAFWKQVRDQYLLKPDYINLENGYYNFVPKPILDKYIQHIRDVNYQGSYYMRTVQWENKKRIAAKLAPPDAVAPSDTATSSVPPPIEPAAEPAPEPPATGPCSTPRWRYFFDGGAIPFVYGSAAVAASAHLLASPPDRTLWFDPTDGGASRREETIPDLHLSLFVTAATVGLAALPSDARWFHTKGMVETLLTTAALTEVTKNVFVRHRPSYDPETSTDEDDRQSFFSGHASLTLATTTYLGLYLDGHVFARSRTWGREKISRGERRKGRVRDRPAVKAREARSARRRKL